MNTYSHLLITLVGREGLKKRGIQPHLRGIVLGSIMPDMALFALTFGYWIGRMWFVPILPGEGPFGPMYDDLYFHNPFWVISHNLFHAPLIIATLAALGYWGMQRAKPWSPELFWFALACGLHSLIDIPTHANDGPLLLFPLNWDMRFNSPISYWDSQFYGEYFSLFEHLLDLGIIAFFVVLWIRRRYAHGHQPASAEQ